MKWKRNSSTNYRRLSTQRRMDILMKFELLEKELTKTLLHAFMFDKIVNKDNNGEG